MGSHTTHLLKTDLSAVNMSAIAFYTSILCLLQSSTGNRLEDFDHFPSFVEMEDYLYQVAQNYSDLVELSVEGQTEEGRPIYLLKIGGDDDDGPLTSPSATAAIFIDAGIHAREWIAPSPAFYIIDSLVT